jgi:hypothetical protein
MKLATTFIACSLLPRVHGFQSVFKSSLALSLRATPVVATFLDNDLEPLVIVPAIDIFPMTSSVKYDPKKMKAGAVMRFVKEKGLETVAADPFELVAHELKPFSSNIKVHHASGHHHGCGPTLAAVNAP